MATIKTPPGAFVTVLWRANHRPELWLVVRCSDGTIKPVADTGPVRLPPEWEAVLRE
jgi:hypothetical protein